MKRRVRRPTERQGAIAALLIVAYFALMTFIMGLGTFAGG